MFCTHARTHTYTHAHTLHTHAAMASSVQLRLPRRKAPGQGFPPRSRHPSMLQAGSELHRLCRNGDLSAIRSYLNETITSAVINKVAGLNGCTPLHEAAMAGRAHVIQLLAEECDLLNLNVRTQQGPASTALHLAAERGHVECVLALLECGASLDAVDRRCRTAKDIARETGKRQVVHTITLIGKQLWLCHMPGWVACS